MNRSVHVADAAFASRRDEAIARLPGATLFHRSAWLDTLERTYGFRTRSLYREDVAGHLTGYLPLMLVDSFLTGRRLVSLPCTNVAGPIAVDNDDQELLIQAAIELARTEKCKYLEVRGMGSAEPRELSHVSKLDYFGSYVLDLLPAEKSRDDVFDKRVRRGIAKATKNGVTAELSLDLDAMREFYRLNLLTRHKHGVPPQPWRFFETMLRALRSPDRIRVVTARRNEVTLAALVLLCGGDTVTYAYGASDPRYLCFAPNHALFATAVHWARIQGYHFFDFGRTAPENTGLAEFKRQWGASYVGLPYLYWPAVGGFVAEKESGVKHRIFARAWRQLPVAVTAVLGPPIYRHLV